MNTWKEALTEYAQLREEIGRLEEEGECCCEDFHTCGLCTETSALDQEAEILVSSFGVPAKNQGGEVVSDGEATHIRLAVVLLVLQWRDLHLRRRRKSTPSLRRRKANATDDSKAA
jgi:hypothetical protein